MSFNSIFSWIIKKRMHQIDLFRKYPIEVQREVLLKLLHTARKTEYGKKYNFSEIKSNDTFRQTLPLQDYTTLKPIIDKLMDGEKNVLWPSETKWFAKSSGTTSARSKLIPVTRESLEGCHYKGGKDLLAMYYHNYPDRKLYNGKHLIVGGSAEINVLKDDAYFGDLSAIILKNLPWWAERKRTPSKEIALMSDWEAKIEKMAQSTKDEDVYIIAGVPSWTLILINRILEITGKRDLREVWPNLELFMHGGVSFAPYRKEFELLIPHKDMHYVETFNASEGFFGIQDLPNNSSMLLMLDYGVFYEFIPMSEFDGVNSKNSVSLEDVELGVNYAIVISTTGGLWRYIIGDTIQFTEKKPFRFRVTGRTKCFINTFGEELIVENVEKAIAEAQTKTNAQIRDYHGCPIYMQSIESGGHEWLIEFIKKPDNMQRFIRIFDEQLRELNSDYDAKRIKNLVLAPPKVIELPQGTFNNWLQSQNKLGGQNKVPRLANDRDILEQVLQVATVK